MIIPEPGYPIPSEFQHTGTFHIIFSLLMMLPAIQFHHQLTLEARKVHNIFADRHLQSKLETRQSTITQ